MNQQQRTGSIAIFAPYGNDGPVLNEALQTADLPTTLCTSPMELYRVAQGEVGAFLLSQEALSQRIRKTLASVHENQPLWSAVPMVLLTDDERRRDVPGYSVTRLRRPVSEVELVSVMRLALEARSQQIGNRELLASLAEANVHLETKVAARTADLQQYVERLEREIGARGEAEAQLRRARSRLMERREKAQRRMGRDLHDDVLQRVMHLNMRLAELLRGGASEAVASRLREFQGEVLEIANGIRRVIRQLRPAGLALGILSALEGLVENARKQYENGPRIQLSTNLDGKVSEKVTLCVYRSAQELLRNGVRHARAERIDVRLEVDEERVKLTVTDDGVGFEPPARLSELGLEDHFGLLGVEEHAQALAGSVAIDSAPGEGTSVVVEVPLRSAQGSG